MNHYLHSKIGSHVHCGVFDVDLQGFSRHKLEFAIGFPRHPGTCELIPYLPTLLLATSAFEPWGGDVKSTWLSTQAFFLLFCRMRSEGFSF
jgi:hypothetical protein